MFDKSRGLSLRRILIAMPLIIILPFCCYCWFYSLDSVDLGPAWAGEILVAREPIAQVLLNAPWKDQAHFYFLYLKFWDVLLGPSVLAARIPVILILPLIFVQMFSLCLELGFGRRVAWTAVLLGMLSPFCEWEVWDGRMYPLVLSLILASIISAFRFLKSKKPAELFILVVSASLAVNLHFFAFFYEGLIGLFLAVTLLSRRPLGAGNRRAWSFIFLGGILFLALSSVQVYRMWLLLSDAPRTLERWSVSSDATELLRQIISFLFVSSDWGSYWIPPAAIKGIFYSSSFLLAVIGFYLSPPRAKAFIFLWVPFSWTVLWYFAGRLDLRDRYFLHLWPVCILLLAQGACAVQRGNITSYALLRTVRLMGLLTFASLSAVTLYHNSQREAGPYSRLLPDIEKVLTPKMIVYDVAPHWTFGALIHAAEALRITSAVSYPLDFNSANSGDLQKQIDGGHDFIFFFWGDYRSRDFDRWREQLKAQGFAIERMQTGMVAVEMFRNTGRDPSLLDLNGMHLKLGITPS